MNIKKIVITAVVSILADKGIIRKSDSMTDFIADLFGQETETDRIVRELDAASDKLIEKARTMHINHKFRKVTKDF